MTRQATTAEIRAHWGHGQGSRRVRITRTDWVRYYGSTVDTDRQHDYWHLAGRVADHVYDEYMGEVHVR